MRRKTFKKIGFFAFLGFVLSMAVGTLASCGPSQPSVNADGKIIPSYEGMQIDGAHYYESNEDETLSFNNKVHNRKPPEGGTAHEPDDTIENSTEDLVDIEFSSDMPTAYHVMENDPFEIHLKFNNPDKFEIVSFIINGTKFLAWQENVRVQDVENIYVEWSGLSMGYHDLVIEQIKYISDTTIRKEDDVRYNADRTIKVSVEAPSFKVPTLSGMKFNYNYNDFSIDSSFTYSNNGFDINLAETYFAVSDGENVIYNVPLKEGYNTHKIAGVVPNTKYQYSIAVAYDRYDGRGKMLHTLGAANLNSNIAIEEEVITKTDGIRVTASTPTAAVIHEIALYENSVEEVPLETYVYNGNTYYDFDGLYSDHTYILSILYSYTVDGVTYYCYADKNVTTLKNPEPAVDIKYKSSTFDTLTVDFEARNTEFIENYDLLVYEKEDSSRTPVFKSDKLETTLTLENLYSDTYYVFEYTLDYDLKDNHGIRTKVCRAEYYTKGKADVKFTFKNSNSGPNFISFTLDIEDKDNILLSATLSVSDYNTNDVIYTKELDSFDDQMIKVENLLSNKKFKAKVVYKYDKSDGTGEHNSTSETHQISTLNTQHPNPQIWCHDSGYDYIKLNISYGDYTSVTKSSYVNVYLEPLYETEERVFVEKVETVQGYNTFSGLYSGRNYFFDFHLIYDLYDGDGEREKTVEYNTWTWEHYVPYISVQYNHGSHDHTLLEFNIEHIDSVTNYKSYLVNYEYDELAGKNVYNKVKELDLRPGSNKITGLGSTPLTEGVLFEIDYDLNNGAGAQTKTDLVSLYAPRIGNLRYESRYEEADLRFDYSNGIKEQEYDVQIAKVEDKQGPTWGDNVLGDFRSLGQLEANIDHTVDKLDPGSLYYAYVETDGLDLEDSINKNKYYVDCFTTLEYYRPNIGANVIQDENSKTSVKLRFDYNFDSVVEYELYLYHDEWNSRTQKYDVIIDKTLELSKDEITVDGLYSGFYYGIGFSAKYKSPDGSEILNIEHEYINGFSTDALIRPEFTASNLITGYNSFTFNFNMDDPDNAVKDYNVVVRDAYNWSYAKTLGKVAPGKVHVNNLYESNFVVIVEYQCDYNNPNNSGLETVNILENVILGAAPVYIFSASNVQSSYDTISFDFNIDETYKELQSYRVYVVNDNTRSEVKDLGQLEKGKYTIEGLDGDASYSVYIEYQYKSTDEQIRTGLWELFTNIKTKISGIPYVNISNTSEGYHNISFDVSVNSDVEIINTKYIIKNPNGDQVGVVENPEDNHVVFDELNASTGYTVVVEFTVIDANGETKTLEEVFVTFAMTLSYSAPGFAANNIKIGNNFFEFDFVVNDPDNVIVGDYNVKILDSQGNLVKNLGKLESGKQRVSGLFTGQYYEVVVDFKYDLKDGYGETPVQTTRLLAEYTKWTEHVQFIANHFVVDEDTISFDFNVIDNDNMLVGDYVVKLQHGYGWGTIKQWTNLKPGRVTVDNLDSGTPYYLIVDYKFNNSDGAGIQSTSNGLCNNIYTNQKTSVDVSADNFEIGYDKVSFDFVMEDPSGVLVDTYYIEVRDEETQAVIDIINNPQTGRVVIDGLKSGKHYSFKLVYTYNMNDGNGNIEVSHYLWSSYTTAYSPVDVSINSVTTGYETITFTLSVNDKDGILKDDFHINIKDENGTIVKTIDNPEAGEITVTGLNSDTKYFIELVYTYNMNDGQGDLVNTRTVWSGNTKKYTPVNIHINNVSTDYEEISFTLNIDDKDNRLTGNYYVNIVTEEGVVVDTLDSPESGEYKFSNLNANTTYHIEIVYTYDLNNGNGPVEVKEELWFGSTKEYGAVNVTLNNLSTNEESIRFTINVDDEFGVLVGDVYVDIVHDSTLTVVETIKVTSGEEIVIDGLLSNNDYSLVIRYVSDMKDGNGPTEKATTVWYGHTNAYDAVNVNITNFTYDKESLTFDYIAENPKGLDVIVIIEIYDHNIGELVTTYNPTLGSNTISGLRSDRYYRVNVRYIVDYNDGADPVENWLGDIYYFQTESYDVPNVNVDNVTTTETTLSFDVFVDDKNNHILDITADLMYDGRVEQTMTIEGSGRYTFENTYSSTNYEVIITVTFDRNTGHEETITRSAFGYTSDYAEPKVGVTNVRTDENSITFDLDIDDPNGFVKDAYAVLYNSWTGDEITRLEDLNLKDNKFTNIYSEHCYHIEIVYTFNSNLREDRVSSNYTYNIYTCGYVINTDIENVVTGNDSVTFDVNIEDEHNRLVSASIQLVDDNNYEIIYQTLEYTGNGSYTFENLYSCKAYTIIVSVQYDRNSYYENNNLVFNYVYEHFTTGSYDDPIIEITNVRTDENSVTFDLDIQDPNGHYIGAYAIIRSSWTGEEIARLDNLSIKDNKFENIYSGHAFNIDVIYTFNANTIEDVTRSITRYDVWTTEYVVAASINNIVADYDSITFDVNLEDEHNRVTNAVIQLINPYNSSIVYQEIEYTGNGTYTFENLYSDKYYEIRLFFVIDKNHHIESENTQFVYINAYFTTLAYDVPNISWNVESESQHTLKYTIQGEDVNNFIKYYSVKVYDGDNLIQEFTHYETGVYYIEGLYADHEYKVEFTFVYNLNTEEDQTRYTETTWICTSYYRTAELNRVEYLDISYNQITLDVALNNPDNLDSYLLIHVYNYETGEFIKTLRFDNPTTGQFTIDGLDPYITYTFALELFQDIKNGNGFGKCQETWNTGYATTPGPVDAYFDAVIVDNTYTSIYFSLKLYNEHNTLAEGDVVVTVYDQDNNVIATFVNPGDEVLHIEGLEPNKLYVIDVTYYVDRMDGNGPVQTSVFTWVGTKGKLDPTFETENIDTGYSDAEFDLVIEDQDNTLVDYEVYAVRRGWGDYEENRIYGTIDEHGHVTFNGLYDGVNYNIYIVYTYNYGNSDGNQSSISIIGSFTTKEVTNEPTGSITLVEVTENSITIDVVVDDEHGIVEEQYIKIMNPNDYSSYYNFKISGSGRYTIENLGSGRNYYLDLYLCYYDDGYYHGENSGYKATIENGVNTLQGDTPRPSYSIDFMQDDYGYLDIYVKFDKNNPIPNSGYVSVCNNNYVELIRVDLDENYHARIQIKDNMQYYILVHINEDINTLIPTYREQGHFVIELRDNYAPSFDIQNVITHDDAATGYIVINDPDNTFIDATYKLYYYDDFMEEYVYVKDVEVDENGHFVIKGLEQYVTYYIFVDYTYDLGQGEQTSQVNYSFWVSGDTIKPKTQATNGRFNEDGTFSANIQAGARKEYVTGYTVNIYDGWGNLIDTIEIEGNSSTITVEWLSQYDPNCCRIELTTHYDCNDGSGVHSFTFNYYFYR